MQSDLDGHDLALACQEVSAWASDISWHWALSYTYYSWRKARMVPVETMRIPWRLQSLPGWTNNSRILHSPSPSMKRKTEGSIMNLQEDFFVRLIMIGSTLRMFINVSFFFLMWIIFKAFVMPSGSSIHAIQLLHMGGRHSCIGKRSIIHNAHQWGYSRANSLWGYVIHIITVLLPRSDWVVHFC